MQKKLRKSLVFQIKSFKTFLNRTKEKNLYCLVVSHITSKNFNVNKFHRDEYTAVLMDTIEKNEVTISSEKLHYTVMWLGTKSGFVIKTLFLSATDKKIVLEKRKVFDPLVCNSDK